MQSPLCFVCLAELYSGEQSVSRQRCRQRRHFAAPLAIHLFCVIAESLRRRFRGKVTGSANISPRPLAIHLILCYIITILRKTVVKAVYNIYYKSFPKIFQRYFFPLFRRKEYIVIFHKDALEKLVKIHNNKERKLQYNDNFTLFRTGLAISRYGK